MVSPRRALPANTRSRFAAEPSQKQPHQRQPNLLQSMLLLNIDRMTDGLSGLQMTLWVLTSVLNRSCITQLLLGGVLLVLLNAPLARR